MVLKPDNILPMSTSTGQGTRDTFRPMGKLSRPVGEDSTGAIAEGAWLLSRLAIMVSTNCNETGLTLQQYRMLLKIVDQPMRASALARASGSSRASLSAMIRNLEQRGLVKRTAVEEDLRGVAVEVTTAGRAAVRKADERMARV